MKQVVILTISAFEDRLCAILDGLDVPVFSKTQIEGVKNTEKQVDTANWFAAGKESDFSIMFFAFVADDVAIQIMDSIAQWNNENESKSPMHAYMLEVNRSI